MSEKVKKLKVGKGGKESKFKVGDWIIATQSLQVRRESYSTFGFNSGSYMDEDRKFMDKPIKILGVTDNHIVYEWYNISNEPRKAIIAMDEVNNRKFIIADQCLIDVAMQDKQ